MLRVLLIHLDGLSMELPELFLGEPSAQFAHALESLLLPVIRRHEVGPVYACAASFTVEATDWDQVKAVSDHSISFALSSHVQVDILQLYP